MRSTQRNGEGRVVGGCRGSVVEFKIPRESILAVSASDPKILPSNLGLSRAASVQETLASTYQGRGSRYTHRHVAESGFQLLPNLPYRQ
jgi:hypothetical protein